MKRYDPSIGYLSVVAAVWLVFGLGPPAIIAYVAWHFISKFW